MGWAITGACPEPIYAQIGSGEYWAIATFLGAFAGMYLYAYLKPQLPHWESIQLNQDPQNLEDSGDLKFIRSGYSF
jgi:uncharacterized membrane protein YedE/YeeE